MVLSHTDDPFTRICHGNLPLLIVAVYYLNGRQSGATAMSRFTTAILPLAVPSAVGVIVFASAGRWDLPFVWAILGILAAFYLALAAFADPGMMRERLAPGPETRTSSHASWAQECSSGTGFWSGWTWAGSIGVWSLGKSRSPAWWAMSPR